MIAYNKTDFENRALVEQAHSLQNAGFISKEQYNAIHKELATLKGHKNILLRLGFFLLGCLLYSSICGFISLVSIEAMGKNYSLLLYFYSLVGLLGAEFSVNQKYYSHGLDDAFLLGAQLIFAVAVGLSTNANELVIALTLTLASFLIYLRYLHLITAVVFCIAATATIFYFMMELGPIGQTLVPCVLMLFSAGLYYYSEMTLRKLKDFIHSDGLILCNNYSLILFYLAGNYLVVRELSTEFLGQKIPQNGDIPYSFLFYAFTAVIPIVYLVYSLRNKYRRMLWIGLVTFILSIYSIWFYYTFLSVELLLTVGGISLFTATFYLIKKLENKESGITFKEDLFLTSKDLIFAEAVIASQVGLEPEVVSQSNIEFGGGEFSGGGSGGNF